MRGNRVRKWSLGKCEGAVSDDSTGTVYVSVEREGIYAFNPLGETQPQLVVQLEPECLRPAQDAGKWLLNPPMACHISLAVKYELRVLIGL